MGGKSAMEGDLSIDGIPGTGARITLDYSDTQGSVTGSLLPAGKAVDQVEVEGIRYDVSIVDAANPHVFITADQKVLREEARHWESIRIGHPAGFIPVESRADLFLKAGSGRGWSKDWGLERKNIRASLGSHGGYSLPLGMMAKIITE